jgi:hypothetical protein
MLTYSSKKFLIGQNICTVSEKGSISAKLIIKEETDSSRKKDWVL